MRLFFCLNPRGLLLSVDRNNSVKHTTVCVNGYIGQSGHLRSEMSTGQTVVKVVNAPGRQLTRRKKQHVQYVIHTY